MPNVKWDVVLGPDQRTNPVMRTQLLTLPENIGRFPEMLETMFPSSNQALKTWGRTPGITANDPHWIGVRKGTNLHVDIGFARYTHQIMVNVDDGYVLRGTDKAELPLVRGLYFVLDTHSPHQLWARARGPQWYLAISMDTHKDDVPDDTIIGHLLGYAGRFEFKK